MTLKHRNLFKNIYFIVGLSIIILTGALLANYYMFKAHQFGHPDLGQFGDLYGGVLGTIVSAITLIYLIVTVDEIKTQNKYIRKQIEQSDFMMLLHNYHEIIEDLDFEIKDENNICKEINGREALKEILENHNELYQIKHIVKTAVYILKFPKNNNIDNHFESTPQKYFQEIFIPTLSDSEKMAILKIEYNSSIQATDNLEEEFENFVSRL